VTSYSPDRQWGSGLSGIVVRVIDYMIGDQDDCVQLSTQHRVPIFWSSRCGFCKKESGVVRRKNNSIKKYGWRQ
jgi:hypothetical protein